MHGVSPLSRRAQSHRLSPRLEPLETRQLLATFTVNDVRDSGPGSLRQAILDADSHPGPGTDLIAFAIPGAGVHTISLISGLPAITRAVSVDGRTQPGYAGSPVVMIDGSLVLTGSGGAANGLVVSADGSSILGLAIGNFPASAIHVVQSSGVTIRGNYLGVDASGRKVALNNIGISLDVSSHNTIGGTAPGDGNVISGNNSAGIYLSSRIMGLPNGRGSSSNRIEGNLIGTDAAGTSKLGIGNTLFQKTGILIDGLSDNNTIGGTTPGAGNVIAGSNQGILFSGPVVSSDPESGTIRDSRIPATGNLIQGNSIGTDRTSKLDLGNAAGIVLDAAQANTIGGTTPGTGNTFAFNTYKAIAFGTTFLLTNNEIVGNRFGPETALADIGVTVSGSNAFKKYGDPIRYIFTITNHGPSFANNLRLQLVQDGGNYPDIVEPGLAQPEPGTGGFFDIITLRAGESTTLVVDTRAGLFNPFLPSKDVVGLTLVGLDPIDPDTTNDSASGGVDATDFTNLKIAGTIDRGPLTTNRTATATFTVTNEAMFGGITAATGVTLSLGFISPWTVVDAIQTTRGNVPSTTEFAAGALPRVRIGRLNPNESVTVTVHFRTMATGPLILNAGLGSDQGGPFTGIGAVEKAVVVPNFEVTDTADSGPGSLRQAILDAIADPARGADVIAFAIPGAGVHTILLASPLPAITRPIFLDGSTEPGYGATIPVVLDGSRAAAPGGVPVDGLRIDRGAGGGASGSRVKGLEFVRFSGSGIAVDADFVQVTHVAIGSSGSGVSGLGNARFGVEILGGSHSVSVTDSLIAHNGFRALGDFGSGTVASGNTTFDNGTRAALLTVESLQPSASGTVGQSFLFTYIVKNLGPAPATDVVVRLFDNVNDPLAPLTLVSASTTQGSITTGATLDGRGPFANLGTIPVGGLVGVTVLVRADRAGTDQITVSVSATEQDVDPNSHLGTTTILVTPMADLVVSGVSPSDVGRVSMGATFAFLVDNRGPGPATGVVLLLDLTGFSSASFVEFATSQGSIRPDPSRPGLYVATLGTLAPGARASIAFFAQPIHPGPLYGSAAVSGDQSDPVPTNNLAFVGVLVVPDAQVTAVRAETSQNQVTGVRLTFDVPLVRAKAEDLHNYHLSTTRHVGRRGIRVVEVALPIGSAHYNPARRTVTLRLKTPLPITNAPINLIVGGPGSVGLTGIGGPVPILDPFLTTIRLRPARPGE